MSSRENRGTPGRLSLHCRRTNVTSSVRGCRGAIAGRHALIDDVLCILEILRRVPGL